MENLTMLELSEYWRDIGLKKGKLIFKKFLSVFGSGRRPFIYQEVIDLGGEPIKNTDYTGLGRVTEFKYGQKLSEVKNLKI